MLKSQQHVNSLDWKLSRRASGPYESSKHMQSSRVYAEIRGLTSPISRSQD